MESYAYVCFTPVGPMTLVERDGALAEARFGEDARDAQLVQTPLLQKAERELLAYFRGECKRFTVPLRPEGTAFQRRCWEALGRIPYGETRAYQQLAEAVGNPRACRAVGMANHLNPLPVFIPCHRVIGKNGKLTGYAGGIAVKELLLQLEAGKKG